MSVLVVVGWRPFVQFPLPRSCIILNAYSARRRTVTIRYIAPRSAPVKASSLIHSARRGFRSSLSPAEDYESDLKGADVRSIAPTPDPIDSPHRTRVAKSSHQFCDSAETSSARPIVSLY